jgi:GTPase SAR1 family protein
MTAECGIKLSTGTLDELNTAEAISLHNLIDTLGACGVGEIVDLPLIIVVGEQSSGKSSVLEAISRVRFPIASGVCTRFATEIVLRKADQSHVDVSICFADRAKPTQTFEQSGFSEDDFPSIIQDAKSHMGIAAGSGRDFSKDVLRIEVEGPNMYPLKLVDLPGIFHIETAEQSNRGRETVDQLVEAYMAQTNSIILVVIEANNQIARHVALGKVKQFDPARERTLGVITKPDLATKGSEAAHIKLAKNQEAAHKLKLGWHVLKNNCDENIGSLDARDRAEAKFFETSLWKAIAVTDRGVAWLRKNLSSVLYDQIRRSLPCVIRDIETSLEGRQQELNDCGVERSSLKEMRWFVLSIATEFQRLSRDATNGYYADEFLGNLNEPKSRLRSELRSFHRAFDYIMRTKGHGYSIEPRAGEDADLGKKLFLTNSLDRFLQMHPYSVPSPKMRSRKEINLMLDRLAAANEGRELPGSCNSELAIQLFQDLSTPWELIAHDHVQQVTSVVKAFIEELLRYLVGDDNLYPTLEAIMAIFVDPFFEQREKILYEKVDELLEPFNQGYAIPLDSEFRHLITKWTVERLARKLQVMGASGPKALSYDDEVKKLTKDAISAATELNHSTEGGPFATERILDMTQAYYEMARRTFTNNMANLAIEKCLVRHLPEILTPTRVGDMDDKELKEIAAESESVHTRRKQLEEEIATLREGLEKCKRWRPRPELTDSTPASNQATTVNAASRSAHDGTALKPDVLPFSKTPIKMPIANPPTSRSKQEYKNSSFAEGAGSFRWVFDDNTKSGGNFLFTPTPPSSGSSSRPTP